MTTRGLAVAGCYCILLMASVSGANAYNVTSPEPSFSSSIDMTWECWVALMTTITILFVLGFELAATTAVMVSGTLFLTLCGIITIDDMYAGLSNNGVVAIAMLFILVDPLTQLGGIKWFCEKMLASSSSSSWFPCLKVSLFGMLMSGLTNNTPLVALLTPLINGFCRSHNISSSQILLSMNYATLIGGSYTLIGTSTNLLFDGLMRKHGMKPLDFFEPMKVSGGTSLVLLIYLVFAPSVLLPKSVGGMFKFVKDHGQEFFTEMRVLASSSLIGESVGFARSRLPSDDSVRLIEIVRNGISLFPLEDTTVIGEEDHLVFSGNVVALQQSAIVLGLAFLSDDEVVADFCPRRDRKSSVATSNNRCINGGASEDPAEVDERATLLGSCRPVEYDEAEVDEPADRGDSYEREISVATRESSAQPRLRSQSSKNDIYGHAAAIRLAIQDEKQTPVIVIDAVDGERSTTHTPAIGFGGLASIRSSAVRSRSGSMAQHSTELVTDAHTEFYEVVIANQNPCVGKTVSSRSFQHKFRVSILACRSRDGRDLTTNGLRNHVLGAGDTLLLLATTEFGEENEAGKDFFVVSSAGREFHDHASEHFFFVPRWMKCIGQLIQNPTVKRKSELSPSPSSLRPASGRHVDIPDQPHRVVRVPPWYGYLVLPIFLGCILSVAAFEQNISLAACVGVFCVVSLGLRTPAQAIECINWDIILMIAFSFGLGTAMDKSGLADVIGQLVVDAHVKGLPLLIIISFAASITTNVVVNQAAAQVLFPIVFNMYRRMGHDPRPGIMCLICVTSYSFSTPYGSPTNLMVLGPGGYKAKDFVKFGVPLNFLAAILIPIATAIVYDEW